MYVSMVVAFKWKQMHVVSFHFLLNLLTCHVRITFAFIVTIEKRGDGGGVTVFPQ